MSKPAIEPATLYENLHVVARDYLDRLRQSLVVFQQPDDPGQRATRTGRRAARQTQHDLEMKSRNP